MADPNNQGKRGRADGIEALYRVVRDTLGAKMGADESERLAATVVGEVASYFTLRRSDLGRNALFEMDMEDALRAVLDDPDVRTLRGRERVGAIAASLLAALDDKWDFRLRPSWLRRSGENSPPSERG